MNQEEKIERLQLQLLTLQTDLLKAAGFVRECRESAFDAANDFLRLFQHIEQQGAGQKEEIRKVQDDLNALTGKLLQIEKDMKICELEAGKYYGRFVGAPEREDKK